MEGAVSEVLQGHQGVPQHLFLGPLIFTLYIEFQTQYFILLILMIWPHTASTYTWDLLQTMILLHFCVLYSKVNWTPLGARQLIHYYLSFYKAILVKLPIYLSSLLNVKFLHPSLCSLDFFFFFFISHPQSLNWTEKEAFMFLALSACNNAQTGLKPENIVPLKQNHAQIYGTQVVCDLVVFSVFLLLCVFLLLLYCFFLPLS